MATKAILAKQAKNLPQSHRATALCVDAFLKAISEALSKGERIELRGFGTFSVKKQAARKTSINNAMTIPEHGKIIFRPCEELRRNVWNCGQEKKR